MDFLSHLFLAIILSMVWKKRLRWDIVVSGVIIDIDFLFDFILLFPRYGWGVFTAVLFGDVIVHGTFTHSLIMLPVYAYILMKLWGSSEYKYFLAGMGLHLVVDALSYGNMLLWPLVPEYINLNIIPAHSILYPIITGVLALYLYKTRRA